MPVFRWRWGYCLLGASWGRHMFPPPTHLTHTSCYDLNEEPSSERRWEAVVSRDEPGSFLLQQSQICVVVTKTQKWNLKVLFRCSNALLASWYNLFMVQKQWRPCWCDKIKNKKRKHKIIVAINKSRYPLLSSPLSSPYRYWFMRRRCSVYLWPWARDEETGGWAAETLNNLQSPSGIAEASVAKTDSVALCRDIQLWCLGGNIWALLMKHGARRKERDWRTSTIILYVWSLHLFPSSTPQLPPHQWITISLYWMKI